MLITFKSKSHANITMFGEVAEQMLAYMNYGVKVPGGVTADNVGDAFGNLKRHLDKLPSAAPSSNDDDDAPSVSVHTRALPLLALLQVAIDNHDDVRWE